MKRYLVASLVVLGLGAQASAHHSFAATYLEDQSVTIEGAIVQFLLRNPHSFVHVMVKEKDGTINRYVVEWGSPSQLSGKVSRDTLKPGDEVDHHRQSRPQCGRSSRTPAHLQASEGWVELGHSRERTIRLNSSHFTSARRPE